LPFVTVAQGSLYFARHSLRQPAAPAVVFIHGAGGSHLIWPALLRRLAPGWSTYLLDLPGHGRSGGTGSPSIDVHAEAVEDVLRSLGLTAVILVGHSLGGAVALYVVRRQPQLCRKLVLFNSSARFTIPAEITSALEAGRHEKAIDAICRYVCSPGIAAPLLEATRRMLAEVSLATLRADYAACSSFDAREWAGEIDVPALVVGADGDLLTPPEDQRWLAGRIAGARLVMLAGCGHMAVLTNAAECRKALLEFSET